MTESPAVAASYSMADLVALCKRRGFVFPASEIYGGINGFWDFGPLGTALKNNLRDAWWRDMVECPPIGPDGEPLTIVGVDTAITQNPQEGEASGHVGGLDARGGEVEEVLARGTLLDWLWLGPAGDPVGSQQAAKHGDQDEGGACAHRYFLRCRNTRMPASAMAWTTPRDAIHAISRC